jgi:hypothetical protein
MQISLPESKTKLSMGRKRRKLQDNIKMEVTETKYNVKVWTGTRYSQITDLLEQVDEPSGSMKVEQSLTCKTTHL